SAVHLRAAGRSKQPGAARSASADMRSGNEFPACFTKSTEVDSLLAAVRFLLATGYWLLSPDYCLLSPACLKFQMLRQRE
ncbi:MAG: hypothetical protein LC772_02620, partial [Chloroflexi bacterium]|nr:hypothetical protein [Chloroflexota bacterium]